MHSEEFLTRKTNGKARKVRDRKESPNSLKAQKAKTGVISLKTAEGGKLKMPTKSRDRDSCSGRKQESKVPKRR